MAHGAANKFKPPTGVSAHKAPVSYHKTAERQAGGARHSGGPEPIGALQGGSLSYPVISRPHSIPSLHDLTDTADWVA